MTVWSLSRRDSARPTLTDKDTIVLADFDNKTGDPVFDDTLRQGLSVELQQSPFLSLISDNQIQRQLTLMEQPKEGRLTSDIAQQVCERSGGCGIRAPIPGGRADEKIISARNSTRAFSCRPPFAASVSEARSHATTWISMAGRSGAWACARASK
jgi:hypothetical protein